MALNDPYSAYRRQVQITRNVNGQEQTETMLEVVKPPAPAATQP